MDLTHIMAATDESEAGRGAVRAAMELGASAGARVTAMQAIQVAAMPAGALGWGATQDGLGAEDVHRLERSVMSERSAVEEAPVVTCAVAFGIPGVEIPRLAESERADLLVLGRKPRSRMVRLLLGDTADAVARRSRLPCLFVPPTGSLPSSVLVAIDGTERGMVVLSAGWDFARCIGADLRVLTVERVDPSEPPGLAGSVPAARSLRVMSQVNEMVGRDVEVRRGDAVEQILAAVDEHSPDVLVLGYHRGGPPGIIEGGSTARRLVHTAPCAVLTVPL